MLLARLFVVDDHPMLLSAIESFIDNEPDLSLIGTAATAEAAIEKIDASRPDLVLVDISLPDTSGVALIDRIRSLDHAPAVIVLTACEEPTYVRQALASGASGYVTKRSAASDLLQAIRIVLSGGSYVEPRIAARTIAPLDSHRCDPDVLSHRELSVVKLVAQGYCNKEISAFLNVSIKTVETYRVRAVDKLEIRTRSALVRYAHVNGWLSELH